MITACNHAGYLSRNRDRDAEWVSADMDSLLLPGRYYYHLNDPKIDALRLYPICRNFKKWHFPHNDIPTP